MMACACSQRRKTTGFAATTVTAPAPKVEEQSEWTLTKPDGSTETFGSKLEALAARIRAGGGTVE